MAEAEPSLLIVPQFIDNGDALYAHLAETVVWDTSMRARRTATVGRAYNYSGMIYPDTPMPEVLHPVVDKLRELLGFAPNNCLMNFYEDGESTMGFHADSTTELTPGTGVAIVSLGSERRITFRRSAERSVSFDYPLPSGSLLYMSDDIQQEWQHAIRRQENAGGRISLTLRQIARETDTKEN